MTSSADVTAAFCAALAGAWVAGGVTDVVVCPGSRSTPLALAVATEPGLVVHVHHDERSGGFLALGMGLDSGRPAVVVTSSGTAAVELHPAVVEAHQARVPLIVATADRPPELQDVGAPQTIDQTHLYGRSVRWFSDQAVPDDAISHTWRPIGARSVAEAIGPIPGPVHLNLAFREPLLGNLAAPVGDAGHRPALVRREPARSDVLGSSDMAAVGSLLDGRRGVIVAGARTIHGDQHDGGDAPVPTDQDPALVHRLAEALNWPVLADPRSGVCTPAGTTVAAADTILRHGPTAEVLRPEVVLRFGDPLTSKVLAGWLDESAAEQILVHPAGAWIDPGHQLDRIVIGEPAAVARFGVEHGRPVEAGWLEAWSNAESSAQRTIDDVLGSHTEPTEPGVARTLLAALPAGARLVVSSSMPVRDMEWYGKPRTGVRVLANRGANGIDGVTSSAVGVALSSGAPTALLIGDVAFLHDSNALIGLARRGVNLTIVVVDNDGGGIFSFLPQRSAVDLDRFELLFGTPHGVDIPALCAAHGLPVAQPRTAADVDAAISTGIGTGVVDVVLVRTDRDENVAVHAEIQAAVAAALGRQPDPQKP